MVSDSYPICHGLYQTHLDGQASTGSIREALGLFSFKRGQSSTMADSVLELMQRITSDMNKSRRRFLRISTIE